MTEHTSALTERVALRIPLLVDLSKPNPCPLHRGVDSTCRPGGPPHICWLNDLDTYPGSLVDNAVDVSLHNCRSLPDSHAVGRGCCIFPLLSSSPASRSGSLHAAIPERPVGRKQKGFWKEIVPRAAAACTCRHTLVDRRGDYDPRCNTANHSRLKSGLLCVSLSSG